MTIPFWRRLISLKWLRGPAPKHDQGTTMQWRRLLAVSLIVVLASLTYFYVTFPTTLRIAVGPKDSEFATYVRAIADALREAEAPFRLRIQQTSGSRASGQLIDTRAVPLALLRSDDETSKRARALIVAHKRALIMLARTSDEKTDFMNLLTGRPGALLVRDTESDMSSIGQLMAHYGLNPSSRPLAQVDGGGALKAFRDGQIDFLLVLAHPADETIRRLVLDARDIVGAGFKVMGPPGAKGLSERLDALVSYEISAGIFGGSPPLPAEEIKTVAITYEIVATSSMAERRAGLLTKALMEIRPLLRNPYHRGLKVEAPATDEIRRYQPHVGAVTHLNGELQTVFEEYSDAIWLVLLFAGAIGSAITAALGWLGFGWSGHRSTGTRQTVRRNRDP